MYDVSDLLPVDTVAPETHLLGVSPPMLGMRGVAHRFVARGLVAGDGCVVVTTDNSATEVASAVADHAGRESLDRLAVVEATGQGGPAEDVPYAVETVGSPADLTGIGIAVSGLLEELHAGGATTYRVVVDSLSSLLVYTGFERVFQFTHTLTNQIDQIDGTSFFVMSVDVDRENVAKFQGLFDGLLEYREGESGTEYRLRGLEGSDEWRPLDVAAPTPVASSEVRTAPAAGDSAERSTLESMTSLHDAIETVTAAGYTLTLCNYTGSEEVLAELRDYFQRLNVTVRTDRLTADAPADLGILHRGDDAIAMSPVSELFNATRWDAVGDDRDLAGLAHPDVMEHVFRREYTVENGGKLQMVRISRLIETQALEAGTGTLHAGFQRLDRVRDELGTRELYENIASAGVDVHLYGQPGSFPGEEAFTIHTAEDGELAESWFVVYDDGQGVRRGALVSEETAPDEYSGFWTYQPALVASIDGYLRSTYG